MDFFSDIKQAVTIEQVCSTYGVPLVRKGGRLKACCPFHNEKTPSFTIYEDTNSFYCFGCGAAGDVIKLMELLYGLEPLEAAKKLNEDFNLGLMEQCKPVKTVKRAAQDGELLKSFKRWIDNAYDVICRYMRQLEDYKTKYAPKSMDEPHHPLFVEACHNLDYAEYLADCLLCADFKEEIDFKEQFAGEVKAIAVRLKGDKQSRKNTAS